VSFVREVGVREVTVDRDAIRADGRDLAYVEATVVDDEGIRVPRATHEVTFDVSGAGELVGVDNGNLDSDESWVGDSRSAFYGRCIAVLQAGYETGEVAISAASAGLGSDGLTVTVEDAQ
jgi:beta-galactosidase